MRGGSSREKGDGLKRFLPRIRGKTSRRVLALVATAYAAAFLYGLFRPLPQGISVQGPLRDASDLEFLYDLTVARNGKPEVDQRIFDRVFAMIDAAEEFVVLDMFLFNGEHGGEHGYRPLSSELTEHLLAWKDSHPDGTAIFITDEINNFYGAFVSPEIADLRESGIQVITTRMTPLRDSNPTFSAVWRVGLQWFGTGGPGWLPHFLGSTGKKVTARSYMKLLNFKANHRKLVVTEKECIVASANPHDASSFHSNIAFVGGGPVCADVLEAERAVAALSGREVDAWPVFAGKTPPANDPGSSGTSSTPATRDPTLEPGSVRFGEGQVQLVTEGKIRQALLEVLGRVGAGDQVDLAMFYLADRRVVEALLAAAGRGGRVRLVLDPNKDAFGQEKKGIPNRQVARELVLQSEGKIVVRWYDTRGEQFHTKLVVVTRGDSVHVLGGSANLTRRNIGDFNLELDLHFLGPESSPMAAAAHGYFQMIFANEGAAFTLPFEAYQDDSLWKRFAYRIQERTGLSSF